MTNAWWISTRCNVQWAAFVIAACAWWMSTLGERILVGGCGLRGRVRAVEVVEVMGGGGWCRWAVGGGGRCVVGGVRLVLVVCVLRAAEVLRCVVWWGG